MQYNFCDLSSFEKNFLASLPVAQLVRPPASSYANENFVTLLKSANHWRLNKCHQIDTIYPPKINFIIISPFTPTYIH